MQQTPRSEESNLTPLPIFIGYDPKESLAAYVLAHSISRRSSVPVTFTFLRQDVLRKVVYTRDVDEQASTEFSLTRFLVPSMSTGPALFLDCDMLMLADVADLFKLADDKDVYCVQHDYEPVSKTKMEGLAQHSYPRKNWSSLMLFNSPDLSADDVNERSPAYLHQMVWADESIGEIPLEWNWLVGEYGYHENPKCLHWTLGGPWWPQYQAAPYADKWYAELDNMMSENGGNISFDVTLKHETPVSIERFRGA